MHKLTAVYCLGIDACLHCDVHSYHKDGVRLLRPGGRVVMQRFAKPWTSVQFRSGPPFWVIWFMSVKSTFLNRFSNASSAGILHGFGVPGFALMGTMTGFGAIAKEAGFDLFQTASSTLLIWGMPGQVAMASLYAGGSSLIVIFTAVALANMRMMLMSISGADMMGFNKAQFPFFKKLLYIQFLAISGWAQISYKQGEYSQADLRAYYRGFTTVLFLLAMCGTLTGFFMDNFIPKEIRPFIIFITPIYILLLLVNAKHKLNRLAGAIGGVCCPLLYPFFQDWAIFIAGFGGAGLALLIYRWTERQGI